MIIQISLPGGLDLRDLLPLKLEQVAAMIYQSCIHDEDPAGCPVCRMAQASEDWTRFYLKIR